MRWLDDISDLMDMTLSKLQKMLMDREAGVLPSRSHKESDMMKSRHVAVVFWSRNGISL